MIATKPRFIGSGKRALAHYAEILTEDLVRQDEGLGGREALLIGIQGSGKTTLLLKILLKTWENGEIVLWRGRTLEQVHMLPNWKEKCRFFHYEGDNFRMYKIHEVEAEDITEKLKVDTYKNARDLLRKINNKYFNVIYAPWTYELNPTLVKELQRRYHIKISKKERLSKNTNFFWHELFYELLNRKDRRWFSLGFDELDDIFGSVVSGIEFWLLRFFKDNFRDFRKAKVSFYAAVHFASDLNWQVLSKFQTFIYLRGAKIPSSRMVDQNLVLKLNLGQAIIDRGNFGLFEFDPLPKPPYDLKAEITPKEEKPKKRKATKSTWTAAILEIAKEEGKEKALMKLRELLENDEISQRHYYRLRKAIMQVEGGK